MRCSPLDQEPQTEREGLQEMPSGMGFSPSGCWFSTRMERRVKVNTMTSTLTFVNITREEVLRLSAVPAANCDFSRLSLTSASCSFFSFIGPHHSEIWFDRVP